MDFGEMTGRKNGVALLVLCSFILWTITLARSFGSGVIDLDLLVCDLDRGVLVLKNGNYPSLTLSTPF
jgi:hypothetical protein